MNLYNLIIQYKEEIALTDVFLDAYNKELITQLIKEKHLCSGITGVRTSGK
ncbi:hypothetical protein QF024_002888 [Chryseobacterium nepalense]|nr:hypothetical protein [Chryseobacterium nepalense]